MSSTSAVRDADFDLDLCASEPIHIPGSIQPHGALLVVDPGSLRIEQAALGDADLHRLLGDCLGRSLREDLARLVPAGAGSLAERLPASGVAHLGLFEPGTGPRFHVIGHRSDGRIVLEFERASADDPGSFDDVYPHVRGFLDQVQEATSVDDLMRTAVREVRRITKFDRVLVYRFDPDWNGEVMAEDRNEQLPAYLGLRFPASDIPAQARALYRANRLRLIADAEYAPAPIVPVRNPATGKPIDLTYAVLRSVSPVHIEYMRNMGTMASMSISLLRQGRLWGLISCHGRLAVRVPFHVRTACDFVGQVLSMQLAANEASAHAERRHVLRSVHSRLLTRMAAADHFIEGLVASPADLLALTGATGVAIVTPDRCLRVGEAPSERDVRRIVDWLSGQERQDLFVTDHLVQALPASAGFADTASGVLAISISQIHDAYVLWVRPEVVRTVAWAGHPTKLDETSPDGTRALHPRRSFERWQEIVRDRSRPWDEAEVDAATELRAAIVDIVLRKAEETAALSERLTSINKELEAFSYSVSHDLRAPFRHIVGYAQLLKKHEGAQLTERGNRYIDTIVESAISAGTLVDDLLSFSQMGRATLKVHLVDMNRLVEEVRNGLTVEGDAPIEWRIAPLPRVRADVMMLRLAVQNLLDNAIKFSRGRTPPVVEISCRRDGADNVFCVRDNGSGFDMAYVGKLFGVFQRLHRSEDYAGTGIGLANVRRIIERHGGRVWAEGRVDEGAAFYFTLPRVEKDGRDE